jgi:hypothetical protein
MGSEAWKGAIMLKRVGIPQPQIEAVRIGGVLIPCSNVVIYPEDPSLEDWADEQSIKPLPPNPSLPTASDSVAGRPDTETAGSPAVSD